MAFFLFTSPADRCTWLRHKGHTFARYAHTAGRRMYEPLPPCPAPSIRSSRQYAPTPASAPCDKAHYLQKGAIQQWNCSFFLLCYLLPKARLFNRAGGRTDGENPAPPDQRAAASNPGCVAGAGHSWGSPRR